MTFREKTCYPSVRPSVRHISVHPSYIRPSVIYPSVRPPCIRPSVIYPSVHHISVRPSAVYPSVRPPYIRPSVIYPSVRPPYIRPSVSAFYPNPDETQRDFWAHDYHLQRPDDDYMMTLSLLNLSSVTKQFISLYHRYVIKLDSANRWAIRVSMRRTLAG